MFFDDSDDEEEDEDVEDDAEDIEESKSSRDSNLDSHDYQGRFGYIRAVSSNLYGHMKTRVKSMKRRDLDNVKKMWRERE